MEEEQQEEIFDDSLWDKQEPSNWLKWDLENGRDTSQKNDQEIPFVFDSEEDIMSAEEFSEHMWAQNEATDNVYVVAMLEDIDKDYFSSRPFSSRPPTPEQPPRSSEDPGNKSGNEEGDEEGNEPVNAERKFGGVGGRELAGKQHGRKKRKKGSNSSNKKQQQRKVGGVDGRELDGKKKSRKKRKKGSNSSKKQQQQMVCKDFIKKTVSDAVKQYNMPPFDDTFGVKIHQLVYDFCKNYGLPHTIVSLVENIRKKEESKDLPFLSWIQAHHLKKLDGETLLVWTEHREDEVAYSEPVLTSKEYLYDQTKRNNPNRLSEQFGKFSYVVPTENPVSYLYVFLRHCLRINRFNRL